MVFASRSNRSRLEMSITLGLPGVPRSLAYKTVIQHFLFPVMNFAFAGNKRRADESYIPEASRGKHSIAPSSPEERDHNG